jgi:hypothetical protein
MVTKLIQSDEKTTKYILENKIINEKEKDFNINLKKVIMNSPILHKLKQSQITNLFTKLIQEKSKREESPDSSEEMDSRIIRKEINKEGKENEIFVSNSTLETNIKVDNDLKFTFSPMKSIALSRIDSFSKTKKIFPIEDIKNKEAKNLNLLNAFQILDSDEIRENSSYVVSKVKLNDVDNSEINPRINKNNHLEKQFSERIKNKKITKNLENDIIPFEEDELNLNIIGQQEIDKNNININYIRKKSSFAIKVKDLERYNFENQAGTQSPVNNFNSVKRISLNFTNNQSKFINKNFQEGFPNKNANIELIKGISKELNSEGFDNIFASKGVNNENNLIQLGIIRKLDATIRDNIKSNQNLTVNPLGNQNKDVKSSKHIKSIEEFKKLRAKRINHESIISAHSIIDYSINKSDYISYHERKRNNSSVINLLDKDEKERSLLINEKIKIGNEKIKDLISKTKKKGHFGPYFSLCRNCNQRNNEFYNNINVKNAIGILKVISDN